MPFPYRNLQERRDALENWKGGPKAALLAYNSATEHSGWDVYAAGSGPC